MLSKEEFKKLVEQKAAAERARTAAVKRRNKRIFWGIGTLTACLAVCLVLYPPSVSLSDGVYGGGSTIDHGQKSIVLGDSELELQLKNCLENISSSDLSYGNAQDDITYSSPFISYIGKKTIVITDNSDGQVVVYTLRGSILTANGVSRQLTKEQYKKINELIDKITKKER